MKKQILSIFLCAFIIFGVIPFGTVSASAESGSCLSADTADITLSGTNAVGEMLAAELEATQSSESTGNVIYSVEVEDDIAVAELSTAASCILFIGIYTEDGLSLVSSGSGDITPETEYAEITLSSAVPQYFYIKAFLVDGEDFSPLSAAYESPLYTCEMQEFLAKTTADFEEERVVNFDDSTDNNFAVLSETVVTLDENSQTNKITYSDTVNDIYTIENIDENVSSLKVGDTFSGVYNGETVIVKIGEIVFDGNTATILGEDTELNEVFDYVKLDASAGISEDSIDPDSCGDGVTFEGYENDAEARGADISGSVGANAKFSFQLAKKGNDNANVTVAGNIKLKLVFSPKLYISLNYKYLELKLDYSLGGSVSVTGKLETEIPLAAFSMGVPGVRAELVPKFVFSASGSIEVTGTLIKGTVGYGWYSDAGGVNLTSAPKAELEIKAEVTVFVGVCLAPKIKILGGKLADAGLEANLGAELKAAASANTSDASSTSKKHDCKTCIKGEIYVKFSMAVKGKLLNNKKWSLKCTFLEVKLKIRDFYWSVSHGEFALTTCPHISYKLTLTVTDQSGTPVNKADITLNGEAYSTTESGTLSLYLPNGSYNAAAAADGYTSSEKAFTVLNASKGVTLTLESINLINAQSLSLGKQHSAAITESGDLYMWGSNYGGLLGNGTTTHSYTPVKIMSNVASVSLGELHSAAITESGDLYMWGSNTHGELGNGTTTDSHTPVKIMSNVASVSLGYEHSAAMTKSGDLYMWGCYYYGQLGNGTTADSYTPVKIMSNVASVSLGYSHSAAITESGDLYMWGRNHYGQLGNGTTTDSYTPVKITLPESVIQTAVYGIAPVALQSTDEAVAETAESVFDGLLPNTVYNFYIMKSRSAENALSDENLLYLDQGITDENGSISFEYTDKAEIAGAEKFVEEYKNALPDSVLGNTVIAAETNRLIFKTDGEALKAYESLFARFTVGLKSYDITEYTALSDGGLQFICDIDSGLPDNAIIEVRLFATDGGIQYRSVSDINLLISARCDTDKNGTVDSADLIKMRNTLLSDGDSVCDTDGNGTTDLIDMIHLKKHLAGVI